MPHSNSIVSAVTEYRDQIEAAIRKGGVAGKAAAIRSSKPISAIHEAVKAALLKEGVLPELLSPSLGTNSGEVTLTGYIKRKRQDICVLPNDVKRSKKSKLTSLLPGPPDELGKAYMERVIAINVRSQFSSLDKNFDTLFERTTAEAQNLHMQCSNMVLGEIYLIAAPEYDVEAMKRKQRSKRIAFLDKEKVGKYIAAFQAINRRGKKKDGEFKYERVCLLIVDFRPKRPVIYHTNESLKRAGLILPGSNLDITSLSWKGFVRDLLTVHTSRFK